ncbi:hypothetical protein JZ751_003743 [Albula glossodonta]|uniref:Uncharacterized protein n=1 Tax=Albula glossodonta TaxID=121402 RepID=A0A8T2P618_9TELE|nr:hypothetical protein JZ751_003743 [Albula glossodonta]
MGWDWNQRDSGSAIGNLGDGSSRGSHDTRTALTEAVTAMSGTGQFRQWSASRRAINELSHVQIPIMLMPDDFKAYSKIKVDNHLFNK